jgi:hypothetical protein
MASARGAKPAVRGDGHGDGRSAGSRFISWVNRVTCVTQLLIMGIVREAAAPGARLLVVDSLTAKRYAGAPDCAGRGRLSGPCARHSGAVGKDRPDVVQRVRVGDRVAVDGEDVGVEPGRDASLAVP